MGSRKYSKDQITGDIQRVAKLLKRNRLTCREYKAYGKICVGTILSIFGTWNAACKSSGLEIYLQHGPRKSRIKDSELIGDLLSIEQSHGKVTWNAISAYGKYSGNTIKRRFGNLENAMQVAREYSQSMQEITSSGPTRGNSTQPQV